MTNTAEIPPAGFSHPTAMQPVSPLVATGDAGGPPEPPLWRRHLGAFVVAAAILLVGAGGIVTWASASDAASSPQLSTPPAVSPSSPSTGIGSYSNSSYSPADQSFLVTIRQYNVPFSNESGAISLGHTVCSMIGQGHSPATVMSGIANNGTQYRYTYGQAGSLVGASIGAFCPQYGSLVGAN